VSVTENAYTAKDNEIFKKLATNKVFIYHKFKTLLKFLLTYPEMYRNEAALHVRKPTALNGKPIIDVVVEHIEQRRLTIQRTLLNMPEFQEFMRIHGREALLQITGEYNKHNSQLSTKLNNNPGHTEYVGSMVCQGELSKRYEEILKESQNNALERINRQNTLIDSMPGKCDRTVSTSFSR
jgi:hypothetical protein